MKQTNIPKGVVAAVATGLLAAGGWTAWKQSAVKVSVETDPNAGTSIKIQPNSPQPSASSSAIADSSSNDGLDNATRGSGSNTPANVPETQASVPVAQQNVDVYNDVELTDKGVKVSATNIPIKETTKTKESNLQTAFDEMLNNKATGKKTKTGSIPKGTKLLSLKTEANDVYIDLSKEFTSNASTTNSHVRLAQVFLTATRYNKNANVFISIEGQKLEELGGLEVPSPLTRQQFKQAFPMVDLGK
jgi:Sporulation and spore germination